MVKFTKCNATLKLSLCVSLYLLFFIPTANAIGAVGKTLIKVSGAAKPIFLKSFTSRSHFVLSLATSLWLLCFLCFPYHRALSSPSGEDFLYIEVTSSSGEVLINSLFSELTNKDFELLEELELIRWIDLSLEVVEKHSLY